MFTSTLLKGFVLGWSVAWPPGPVNAEMIRRSVLPRERGGGFWPAFSMGLGACSGDFLWALGVALGAGAVVNSPAIRTGLSIVSLLLLLGLAFVFARNAWRTWRVARSASASREWNETPADGRMSRARGTYLLGFTLAITSPWNIGFWFAVIGSQRGDDLHRTFVSSLALAAAVVFGAATWGLVLCVAARGGARFFGRPGWQVTTQALTAVVMLYFAAKLLLQLR